MKRRHLLFAAAAAYGADRKKLLLPTDEPDKFGFRIMWYNPVPAIDQTKWQLEVKGLVEKPQQFSIAQLRDLPSAEQSSRMKCVQCWSSRATWAGFRPPVLLDLVKPTKTAKAVRIDCADKWYEYLSLEELANPRVLFALDMAGEPLSDGHGAPLRLIDPSKYGYKSAKLITSITFVEEGKGSMACDIGPYYTPTGDILPGYDSPLDLGGPKREIGPGEITHY
jgi:methionine sulfoxide reductase catalytic subunit